jgi:hypothetical protein
MIGGKLALSMAHREDAGKLEGLDGKCQKKAESSRLKVVSRKMAVGGQKGVT